MNDETQKQAGQQPSPTLGTQPPQTSPVSTPSQPASTPITPPQTKPVIDQTLPSSSSPQPPEIPQPISTSQAPAPSPSTAEQPLTEQASSPSQSLPTDQFSSPPLSPSNLPPTQSSSDPSSVVPPDSPPPPSPPSAPDVPNKGRKRFLLWLIILLVILVIAGGASFYLLGGASLLGLKSTTETAEETPTQAVQRPTQPPLPSPSPTTPLLPSPTTATPSAVKSSSLRKIEGVGVVGIELTEPTANATISSPLAVKGRANEFEGHVSLRIKDANDSVLGEGFATACMGEEPCPFETELSFNQPSTTNGTVEAFSPDAADGSEKDLVIVPVTFSK